METKQEVKEKIKENMIAGWSYQYSCGLLGIHTTEACALLKSDPDFKKWVDNQRKIIKQAGKNVIYR